MFAGQFPLLSWLIWLPIIGGALCLSLSRLVSEKWIKSIATFVAGLEVALCIPLIMRFNAGEISEWNLQLLELKDWLPGFDVYYRLGVDGISLPLLVLSCLMTLLVVVSAWRSTMPKMPEYLAAFLFLQGFLAGVFTSFDAVLFYIFWEALLIPMFLIIGIWGGKNRLYATIKFFLYTLLGSILLLVAILYLRHVGVKQGEFSESLFYITNFKTLALTLTEQKWLFWAMVIAFAVKVPMWPVHTWLPDAHTEAPTGGSVILAAILLKVGGYGFLRFLIPAVPDAMRFYADWMIGLSLIAIVYIGIVSIMQTDLKRLIAYSSVSHMGFVTLGFFIGTPMGISGGMIQMISHGFISAALFFCVGVLYDRTHTRAIKDYGGVVNTMPVFSALFVFFALANLGLPGTSGFVGEFFVVVTTVMRNKLIFALLAALALVLSATYMLWMTKRVIFGSVSGPQVEGLSDINRVEKSVLGILALLVLLLGVWPRPLIKTMQTTVDRLAQGMHGTKLFATQSTRSAQ